MEQLFEARTVIFWTGFILLIISILFHGFQKNNPAVIFLLLASLFLFLYAAVSIPFLNVWDERFHALVAKNLVKHPLMPTLYDEALLNLPYRWDQSHIWLHKQPFFLWQAALSYKLFGVSEVAFRLPGVLLSCALVYAGYRSGKVLGNENTGYCTGMLIATSFYLFQLVSGYTELDLNDVTFLAYISLSIWALIEYSVSGKFYWVLLVGIFSGFAVLTKWAVGLLVYFVWFIYTLFKFKWNIKKYLPIFISLGITLLIFIPWQVLIFKWYPAEAGEEYRLNLHTFTTVTEGHDGPYTYHLNLIGMLYGSLVPYILIPSLMVFYLTASDKKMNLSLIISILFVYMFFSLAKTKMQSFTIVVALPIYLSVAFFINYIIEWVANKIKIYNKYKISAIILSFLLIVIFRLDFNSLKTDNGFWGHDLDCYNRLKHNKEIFQKLKLPENTVLCNIPGRHFIEAMFYTNLPAYGFIPDEKQYNELLKKGKKIALFLPLHGEIPAYLKNDTGLIMLKDTLELCE